MYLFFAARPAVAERPRRPPIQTKPRISNDNSRHAPDGDALSAVRCVPVESVWCRGCAPCGVANVHLHHGLERS